MIRPIQDTLRQAKILQRMYLCKIPCAELTICFPHLITSRHEITVEKVGINAAQKVAILEIMDKLVYPRDEEYSKLYQQLKDTKLQQSNSVF